MVPAQRHRRQAIILNYLMESLPMSLLLVEVLVSTVPTVATVDQAEVLRFIVGQFRAPELWDKVLMAELLVDILRSHSGPEVVGVEPAPADMLDLATV